VLWFIQDSARLESERSRIKSLESEQSWLEGVVWQITKNGIGFDCEIVLDEKHSYPIHVQFPQFYPSVPPSVVPINDERWSEHQYGSGGDLCLEIGPDNWLSDFALTF
jgi:ubiquitin-protein ligase